ncbi:MAG: TIGR02186 family protein [Methyloligellaceae bacterium]
MHVTLRRITVVLVGLLACHGARVADLHAEEVEVDLTSHHVAVKYDFSGATITLFGAAVGQFPENGAGAPDIVIAVRGPARTTRVHRKERIAGIWINAETRSFDGVPGYYALVTSRELSKIASGEILQRLDIGFASLATQFKVEGRSAAETREFVRAAIGLLQEDGLYGEHPNGVRFMGRHLFRAEFSLPANVPIGEYEADVFLFRKGSLLGQYTTSFDIAKEGLERSIFSMAHNQPLLYGVLSVFAALAAGLGASLLFRQT